MYSVKFNLSIIWYELHNLILSLNNPLLLRSFVSVERILTRSWPCQILDASYLNNHNFSALNKALGAQRPQILIRFNLKMIKMFSCPIWRDWKAGTLRIFITTFLKKHPDPKDSKRLCLIRFLTWNQGSCRIFKVSLMFGFSIFC